MEQSPDVPASDSSGAQRHAGFRLGGARRLIATTLAVVAVLLGGCGVLVIFSLVTEYEAISESDGWSRDVALYLVGIPMVPAVAAALIWPAPGRAGDVRCCSRPPRARSSSGRGSPRDWPWQLDDDVG